MKKILILLTLISVSYIHGFSQIVQAGIGGGIQDACAPNEFKIYLKSDVTLTDFNVFANRIQTLQYSVRIASNLLPAPNLSIKTSGILNPNDWKITSYLGNDGFRYYTITTVQANYASTLVANVETEVMKLAFSDGPALATDVELVTLGNGGDVFGQVVPCPGCGNVLFLYTSPNATSENIPTQLYYHRVNTTEQNMDSYNSPNVTDESWARITGIVLPVKFLGFDAVKNGSTADLKWSVENEDANVDRYEIESSANGADFVKVATVSPLNNGKTSNAYTLSKVGLNASSVTYFRVKQFDKDNEFVISPTRSIKLTGKNSGVSVYPNPVKDVVKVTLELEKNSAVNIVVSNPLGQVVENQKFNGTQGINVLPVNLSKYANGNYTLKIIANGKTDVVPVVKAN